MNAMNRLKAAFIADSVVLGGGNVRLIEKFPPGVRAGKNANVRAGRNANAMRGGYRLWNQK